MWLKTTMRRSCPLLQRQDGDSAHAGLHRHSRHAPTRRRMKTRVGCSPRQRMRERCGRDSANVRCGTTLKQTTKAINLHRRGHLPRMPTERHGRDARTRRNLRTLSSSKTATASVRLTASSKRHHIEFACARVGCADSTRAHCAVAASQGAPVGAIAIVTRAESAASEEEYHQQLLHIPPRDPEIPRHPPAQCAYECALARIYDVFLFSRYLRPWVNSDAPADEACSRHDPRAPCD